MQTSKDVKVKKAVMRIHRVYELLIWFPSSKQAKHSVPDKGYHEGEETAMSCIKERQITKGRRSTCQCQQLLQLSVNIEGERGSAESLLPPHSRVGAWLLHPHQLSSRRPRLIGALQRKGRVGASAKANCRTITVLKCQHGAEESL